MRHCPSTTSLALLALLVALTLLAHDVVMVAGPHETATHANHHDDVPADDTACGELVAVRANDIGPDLDVAPAPGDAVVLPTPLAGERLPCFGDAIVDPVAPRRAMLQVWLN